MPRQCDRRAIETLANDVELLDTALLLAAERLWKTDPQGFTNPDELMDDLIEEAQVELDMQNLMRDNP